MRGRDRAGGEIIRRRGAAKRKFHVRVRIDAAGNDEPVRRIDRQVCFHVEFGADDRNSFAFDQDVGFVIVDGGDDLAVTN